MNPLSYHQQEMELRIRRFEDTCDIAVNHIKNFKHQARGFVNQLSGDPKNQKDRFLQCTKQLDEFMYHIAEFNLTASNLEQNIPKQYKSSTMPPKSGPINTRSHSNVRKSAERKDSRTQQKFNENWRLRPSASRSRSIENGGMNDNKEKNTDERSSHDVFLHRNANGCQPLALPPQPKLDPAVDTATILNANGSQVWLVVDADILAKLIQEMTEFYKDQPFNRDYVPQNVCAYYDAAETKCFLRALYINSEDPEVFLMDTGEFQPALRDQLRPLHPKFCITPPLAHLCDLADVEQTDDITIEETQTELLKQFLGHTFKFKLKMDDVDTTNPQSVYLYFDDGRSLNELLAQALASGKQDLKVQDENKNIPKVQSKQQLQDLNKGAQDIDLTEDANNIDNELDYSNCPEYENAVDAVKEMDSLEDGNIDIDNELDYSKCPEYENALEAVTGYNNRDEIDICKHYTGGEGCFKGHRCKKRHVLMHPDGWTLDRVSVAVKCRPAALPAPGSRHKVKVTHVDDTCRLYLQFEQPEEPMSLLDLVDEMTRSAAKSGPLKLEPAPGELVSAMFSDGRYYRARVLASGQRKTEVMYIDFGNTGTVSKAELRALEPRWLALSARAAPARLAGVGAGAGVGARDVQDAAAARVLKELALDKTMEAHVIARDFDELTVQLLDDGFDIAEQLAAFTGIDLVPYTVEDDSQRRCQHVPA